MKTSRRNITHIWDFRLSKEYKICLDYSDIFCLMAYQKFPWKSFCLAQWTRVKMNIWPFQASFPEDWHERHNLNQEATISEWGNKKTMKLLTNGLDRKHFPLGIGSKLNVHKMFRRRLRHLLNVLCTFNLPPVSRGLTYHTVLLEKNWSAITTVMSQQKAVVNSQFQM